MSSGHLAAQHTLMAQEGMKQRQKALMAALDDMEDWLSTGRDYTYLLVSWISFCASAVLCCTQYGTVITSTAAHAYSFFSADVCICAALMSLHTVMSNSSSCLQRRRRWQFLMPPTQLRSAEIN